MEIDISELKIETKRKMSLIDPKSIKLENEKLSFVYWYLRHLPNPYSNYYDSESKEFHIIVQRDAFMGGSFPLKQEFVLPQETRKVRIDYRGSNLDKLTDMGRIEHFFPKLRPENQGRDEKGIDRSGEDGWL